jgi:hypothetical protein
MVKFKEECMPKVAELREINHRIMDLNENLPQSMKVG